MVWRRSLIVSKINRWAVPPSLRMPSSAEVWGGRHLLGQNAVFFGIKLPEMSQSDVTIM